MGRIKQVIRAKGRTYIRLVWWVVVVMTIIGFVSSGLWLWLVAELFGGIIRFLLSILILLLSVAVFFGFILWLFTF
ncbi:hypothetical protein [Bacteroides graminisolvens]|uniref:hypothetical protein n=1 Tax=Bacteroides graminisolvens TaxID=477666 RepID=UPI00240991A7|nr:hypothetical protein [Bacteroides graminisolvens]